MPIRTQIWTVSAQPMLLKNARLTSEQWLEDMIVATPALLSDDWMLIGRQESTGQGGRVDLLALAPDASLVLIELKRERTPREVVAQALDYASWVERLEANDIEAIYQRFRPAGDLAADFQMCFGAVLEAEALPGFDLLFEQAHCRLDVDDLAAAWGDVGRVEDQRARNQLVD